MRVLVADDSLVMRCLLEKTLSSWGYKVVTAADGAEALASLQQEDAPQLAILDWIMPGFTGPELCRQIRQQNRERYNYILLLTSKSQREDIVEGMGAGADDYVVKPFDQHELEVRLRAGRRIVELQNALLAAQDQLRDQATKDFLTGCWNRAALYEILDRERRRAQRERRPLGLLMIDLDHFKEVNDTYGHVAGDEVLREAVRRMLGSLRPYDALGRYGGEEFLAVLPGCEAETMLASGERLRRVVGDEPFPWGQSAIHLTASVGVISIPPDSTSSLESLINSADEALYAAKRRGRNRVRCGSLDPAFVNPGA